VVLPDGAVLYGTYTGYNLSKGHLVKLSADGKLVASYTFGWDTTPAIYQHDGTYSIITKDNNYAFVTQGDTTYDAGPYYMAQLDKDLKIEWRYQNTNTKSCTLSGGTQNCVEDHPYGFEWCINAPAVDAAGTVYANSEDGNIYAIGQGGVVNQTLFLTM